MKELTKPAAPLKAFHRVSDAMSSVFSLKLNPLHYLGAIAIFLLVVDTISGIYLYLFYNIDPRFCFSSVEGITASFRQSYERSSQIHLCCPDIYHCCTHNARVGHGSFPHVSVGSVDNRCAGPVDFSYHRNIGLYISVGR